MADCDNCEAPDAPPVLDPWGGVHGHLCDNCAARAYDEAQERAMEGPSRPVYQTREELIAGKR